MSVHLITDNGHGRRVDTKRDEPIPAGPRRIPPVDVTDELEGPITGPFTPRPNVAAMACGIVALFAVVAFLSLIAGAVSR